ACAGLVIPRRLDAAEDAGDRRGVIPADAESVAAGRLGPEPGVQKPMVTAMMPPTARRPYPVDLLLCGTTTGSARPRCGLCLTTSWSAVTRAPRLAVPAPVRDRFQILFEPSWGVD